MAGLLESKRGRRHRQLEDPSLNGWRIIEKTKFTYIEKNRGESLGKQISIRFNMQMFPAYSIVASYIICLS